MDVNDVKSLAALMCDMGLTALEFSDGGSLVKMERAMCQTEQISGGEASARPSQVPAHIPENPGVITVESPMVGVFYAAPGADLKPFVAVGDTVKPGDTLCIIEAMKIMNEIAAERGGVITQVLATNKQVVEYGQPLFCVDTGAAT